MSSLETRAPSPVDLAERRWRPFRRGLTDAIEELAFETGNQFTILTHPGVPRLCEDALIFRMEDDGLGFEHDGVRHLADTVDGLTAMALEVLGLLDVERPDQVNAAFPRRVRACSGAFWTDSHCPTGEPSSYNDDLLKRHVQRALIADLGHSPHVDHDGDFVIDIPKATIYIATDQSNPIVTIWAQIRFPDAYDSEALSAVNQANLDHPFVKFTTADQAVHAICRADCWEFSSWNFIKLMKYFIRAVNWESDR